MNNSQSPSADSWRERYLGAVSRFLPAGEQDDICAELDDMISDKLESQQSDDDEQQMLAVLDQLGHPMRLAAGYHQQALIESEVIPIYRLVLKYVLLISLSIVTLVSLLNVGRTEDFALIQFVLQLAWVLAFDGLVIFAIITLIFQALGKQQLEGFYKNWKPQQLPEFLRRDNKIALGDCIVELLSSTFGLLLLNGWIIPGLLFFNNEKAVAAHAVPEVLALLPWFNLILLLSMLLNLINIFQPFWTRTKLFADATLSLIGAVLLLLAASHSRIIDLALPVGSDFIELEPYVQMFVRSILLIFAVVLIVFGIRSLARALKL